MSKWILNSVEETKGEETGGWTLYKTVVLFFGICSVIITLIQPVTGLFCGMASATAGIMVWRNCRDLHKGLFWFSYSIIMVCLPLLFLILSLTVFPELRDLSEMLLYYVREPFAGH